jgi:hypothetical protein
MLLPACISLGKGDAYVETITVKWATENASQVTLLALTGLFLIRIFLGRVDELIPTH